VTVTVRRAAPAHFDRVCESAIGAKGHRWHDRDFVGRWAAGLTFSSDRECWVAEADGTAVAWATLILPREKVGGRLRDRVTGWREVVPWTGIDL
jgi:hypothetical protein